MGKPRRLVAAAALVLGIAGSTGPVVTQAGVSSSPGGYLARKAGSTQQEYLPVSGSRHLAIPGIRGTGGGA